MMKRVFRSYGRRLLAPGLAGVVLLTWSVAVQAQGTRTSSGSSSSGGFTGGSSGSGSGFTGGGGGSGFTGSGNSGTGFTGGTGSTGFSGTSTGFTGSQSMGTGGAGRGSSTTGTGPTQSNPFQTFYANPMAMGLQTNGSTTTPSKTAFGTALYKQTTTTNSSTYGGRGGSSLSGYASATTSSAVSGSTLGMRRDAAYATNVDFARASIAPLTVRADLQQVIARSTSLPSNGNIKVMTDGSVVVLQGTVANDRERRLAEGLVRLTPGVYDVRNELQVGTVQTRTADVEKKP